MIGMLKFVAFGAVAFGHVSSLQEPAHPAASSGQPVVTAMLNLYAHKTGPYRVCARPRLSAPLDATRRQFGTSTERSWTDWEDTRGHSLSREDRRKIDRGLRAALKPMTPQSHFQIMRVPKPLILSTANVYAHGRCDVDGGDVWWLALSRPVVVGNLAFSEAFTIVHGTNPPPTLIVLERRKNGWNEVAERQLWIR